MSALPDALRDALIDEPDVQVAWLFGSQARGTARPDSDVDVAVLLDGTPSLERILDLEAALALALQREVDLVSMASAPPDLAHRVLRDGVLVLERDRAARVRFEIRSEARYRDFQPYRDALRGIRS